MARTKIFVSYSRKDMIWRDRFKQHIGVLERPGLVELWSDREIAAGAEWQREIDAALSSAKVAVLLVSPAFLASKFIWDEEMPRVEAHAADGMDVLPLIARPCAWLLEKFLARLTARPDDGRPLSLGSEGQIDADLSEFVYELAAKIGRSPGRTTELALDAGSDASRNKQRLDLTGEWKGRYNPARAMRLVIQEANGSSFYGKMEYPDDKTVTLVEGTIYEDWSREDAMWTQISGGTAEPGALAVLFRETKFERKGSGNVSFNGEYRALVSNNRMTGAWCSSVGTFQFERLPSDRQSTRG
jgi:TIR domain